MTNNFPIIRLEVDRMHHAIMACLAPALDAEKKQIELLLETEIKNFDFASAVRTEVYRQISQAIQKAVQAAVQATFMSDVVKDEMARLVQNEVRFVLETMQRG